MQLRVWLVSITAILLFQSASAQKVSEKKVVRQLKKDIGYLASDKLEGRRTGSEGEKLAADYITKYYTAEGINGYKGKYIYPFTFTIGRTKGEDTRIVVNGTELKKTKLAYPLSFSGNGKVQGEVIPGMMEQGRIWVVPMFADEDEAKDAHFNWEKSAFERTKEAIKSGAIAVVFYDPYNAKYHGIFSIVVDVRQYVITC